MKTYHYHDYGSRPTLQCTVEAENIEQAHEQVKAMGLPFHRLSVVLQKTTEVTPPIASSETT